MCNTSTSLLPQHEDHNMSNSSSNSNHTTNIGVGSRRRPLSSAADGGIPHHNYQRDASFSKRFKMDNRQPWRRQLSIVGLVLLGCILLALNLHFEDPSSRLPLNSLYRLGQPRHEYSNFLAKPQLVGYLDLSEASTSVATTSSQKVGVLKLKSKPHNVVRIHPTTFSIILQDNDDSIDPSRIKALENKARHIAKLKAVQNSDNHLTALKALQEQNLNNNDNNTIWTWDHQKVNLLGDSLPMVIDWDTYHHPEKDWEEEDAKNNPCQLPKPWMKQSFPTCNAVHDQDMLVQLLNPRRVQPNFLMGTGSMRSVWLLEQPLKKSRDEQPVVQTVLKTLRMKHDFDGGDLDRHRRDALISERLTGSPHFLNIYGYCGNSAIYEYARDGTLYDAIGAKEYEDEEMDVQAHAQWEQWTSSRKLQVAYQVVSAVAALHDIDHDGRPSVAHDDLDITQFVSTDGGETFQLSDFNGAPFISWDESAGHACHFRPLMRGGKTRSPEEYDDDIKYVTEKIDIYAMGSIIFTIVEGQYPFYNVGYSVAKAKVLAGEWPEIRQSTKESNDPNIQALLKAIFLCWRKDPNKRAPAAKIQELLRPLVEAMK